MTMVADHDEDEYSSTARALASDVAADGEDSLFPTRHTHPSSRPNSPFWSRRSLDSHRSQTPRPRSVRDRWMLGARKYSRRGVKVWLAFPPLQRAGLVLACLVLVVLAVLFLVYNERIFRALGPPAKRWRDLPAGWLILWFATFFVSFPPMIGYSTLVTIAGFVFGMYGWFIVATATVVGSTCGFVASRTLLRQYVERMTDKNKQFAALSLVLKHDGLKLLCMIRLCPLPYSFANGAISTIPTVTWPNFMLATAIASPKLLLHVFIGSRLGALAEHGDKMDTKTKMVSYISIAIGVLVGLGTGYFIFVRTKARAKVLEAEEAAAAVDGRRRSSERDRDGAYVDDEDEQDTVGALRGQDDISLRRAHADDEDVERGYRDEFIDDEDATEQDIFEIGDGDDDGEEDRGKKMER